MSIFRTHTNTHAIARGSALFIGLFSLINLLGSFVGGTVNQNTWWIDTSVLPSILGAPGVTLSWIVQGVSAATLIIWAWRPSSGRVRKVVSIASNAALALLAFQNAWSYWNVLLSGELYSGLPVPLSLFVGLLLVYLCARMAKTGPETDTGPKVSGAALTLTCSLMWALLFPCLQIGFFGTTDYRRDADAVVVFGAQVYDDGTLSPALEERMDTAIRLYIQGHTDTIIVSGGTAGLGTSYSGANEAESMAVYAQENGVPSSSIIIDTDGTSSIETVKNTIDIAEDRGFDTIIATSSFYHLPRIKMLYAAEGTDVLTVPTFGEIRRNGTLAAIWREIPAWWWYWLKGAFPL